MDNFLTHSQIELTETLNTPQEYYMTDDTKMPTSVYAAFNIEGRNYIIGLEESKDKGVFILEVGKTGSSGGKTYWWKFHNKSDILPVLSTVLHFTQSATAWLGPKLKGVAVQFKQGASEDMARAVRFAERMIKRSYVKTFTIVPVAQPAVTSADKYYHQKVRFLFIAKKGISVNSLFGGATFKKYDFDNNMPPAEAIAELEPKRIKKQVNTVKPSKKYSFGQFEIDTPDDEELLNKVQNVTAIDNDDSAKHADAKTKADHDSLLHKAAGGSTSSLVGTVLNLPSFQDIVSEIKKHNIDDFTPNHVYWGALRLAIMNATPGERQLLKKAGLYYDPSTDQLEKADIKLKWYHVFSQMIDPIWVNAMKTKGSYAKAQADATTQYLKQYPKGDLSKEKPANSSADLTSTVNPRDIVATMPGSGDKVHFKNGMFYEDGADLGAKMNHIRHKLGYDEGVKKLPTFKNIVSYSGHAYTQYNNPLRQVMRQLFANEPLNKAQIKEVTNNSSKYQKLFKAFNDIKPLPESLWVYRGSQIPSAVRESITPGYEFVDPAFLSTSLHPMQWGEDKMRIFLPKGSRVVPILNHSKHFTENEILLPPSSIIKIVEVNIDATNRYGIHGVFMGSAFKSITELLKKQLTMTEDRDIIMSLKEFIMEEQDKEKYDPQEKFGGEYDGDLAQLIIDALKAGKVKLDPVKK